MPNTFNPDGKQELQDDGGFGYLRDDSRLPTWKTMSPKKVLENFKYNVTTPVKEMHEEGAKDAKTALDARLNRREEESESGMDLIKERYK